jgi:hypothetical protein
VDAAIPVDAQNAPTGIWKTAQNAVSHSAHTPHLLYEEEERPNQTTLINPSTESDQGHGWHAAAHGYDGFLRWAYDAWPADPVRDARHVLWPAGDTFLVYPGGNSSIRFEKLREGIVDFEKIQLVRNWAAQSTDREVRRLANELEQQLKSLRMVRELDDTQVRKALQEGTSRLEALSDRLTP